MLDRNEFKENCHFLAIEVGRLGNEALEYFTLEREPSHLQGMLDFGEEAYDLETLLRSIENIIGKQLSSGIGGAQWAREESDSTKLEKVISEAKDLENIHRINVEDKFSFAAIASFSLELSRMYEDLAIQSNPKEELLKSLNAYKETLVQALRSMVEYWSARDYDIKQFHATRTKKSTEQKRRNRAIALELAIKEYNTLYNPTHSSIVKNLSENKMLKMLKASLDPVLKEKKMYGEEISVSTLRQMLREAYKDGKIKHYPWIRNS